MIRHHVFVARYLGHAALETRAYTRIVQVNAVGYDENVVRVRVPKQDDRTSDEGPRPVTVDVAMEPTAAKSTVSNSGQYTYRASDHGGGDGGGDGGATTELPTVAAAAATAVTVDRVELLDSGDTGRAWDENGYGVGGGPGDWRPHERDDYGYGDNDGNRVDDYDDDGALLQPAGPPMPVQSSSSHAAGRFGSYRCVVAKTVLAPYLVVTLYRVVACLPN